MVRWLPFLFSLIFFLVAGARGALGSEEVELLLLQTELEQLRVTKEAELSSLKTELEQLRVTKEAELSSLKTDLEQLRVNKEAELSSLRTKQEQLKAEVAQIREELEKYQEYLHRLQRLYAMDRYRFPQNVRLFGQPFPLHRHDLLERMDREFLLIVHDVPQVHLWIKRVKRYFPLIQERLWNRGLPDDLKYVAIVESGLRPKARSHAGAVGLWQFIYATGSRYALRRTAWVDERRDPVKSTEAALNYLEDLYDMFGDWFLAVAAYNVGERHIKRKIKRQRLTSYFDLVLLPETERYVFRIASAKVILSDPELYGFDLKPDDLYEPSKVGRLEIHVKRGKLDLVSLAQACGMTFRSFINLNPHFRKSFIPRGKYTVYVSPDKEKEVLSFITQWNQGYVSKSAIASSNVRDKDNDKNKTIHRVKRGESLWEIAQKYNVYVSAIKEWNQLSDSNHIYPGQRLTIYR